MTSFCMRATALALALVAGFPLDAQRESTEAV